MLDDFDEMRRLLDERQESCRRADDIMTFLQAENAKLQERVRELEKERERYYDLLKRIANSRTGHGYTGPCYCDMTFNVLQINAELERLRGER